MSTRNEAQSPAVLLVHTDAAVRDAYREMIEACGYTVVARESLSAAEVARGEADIPAIAVVEAAWASSSTEDLVGELRTRRPDLHLVVVSTHGEDDELASRAERGELLALQAPFTLERLREALMWQPFATTSPAARPARRPVLPVALGIAALAVVAAIVLAVAFEGPPRLPPEVPTSAARGARLDIEEPEGLIEETPPEFRWRSVPGAAAYRISILAPDATLLWEAETRSPDMPAPTHAVDFRPAVRYAWRVEALTDGGRILASSDLSEFEIALDRSRNRR